MSLQFIMGPSGSGKSHYLYEYVTTESLKYPDKRYIVLVPEQFTMQTQSDLVAASPRGGILNVEVLSFQRLAQRVFEEVGETRRVILGEVGKNFVIRKVAGDRAKDLTVMGNHLKKIGYISEVKSMISEFTQYDIGPDFLEEMIQKTEENLNLHYKLKDVKIIYEGFRECLQEKYITGEETLDVLSLLVKKSKIMKDSTVVLDGFTGFTPVQEKLLRQLLQVCKEVVLTVSMDKRENPFVYQSPYQLFALSKQTVTDLVKIAGECGVQVKEPMWLSQEPVYRFQNNAPLGFLESHLFRYSGKTYNQEQDSLQIWRAANLKDEIDFVAQKIRYLVRTKNYRYRDIAVLTNGMESYVNLAKQVFEKYKIPVFMDYKRSILLNSCVEYIRSLISMAEQDFTYESVFRYLRTGLTDLERDEIDILENYVIALGVKGYTHWQEPWIRRSRNMQEPELAKINEIREKFVQSIREVTGVLKARQKTVLDVTKALHAFLLKEGLQEKIQEYQLRFEAEGQLELEKEYAQVYRVVIELFDQFVELLGDERISLEEYSALLDAGLEEAKIGIIPPSIDQVVVGDVERSRIKDIKVVFLVGANDIYIPGPFQSSGLLSELERGILTENGARLAPSVKEKTFIQKFYLYLILTKPMNQVFLTFSKTSADGKALRPSYLVSELQKLFPKLQVKDTPVSAKDKELTIENGIDCLVKGLQNKASGLPKEWQELYSWYKKDETWGQKMELLVDAAFYRKPDSVLTQETAKELYGEILENSVTRLEKFSRCAYSHFLAYGLRLKEREEYQFQALDLGNLFHSAMEKFSNKLEQAGYTWVNLPEETKSIFVDESVEECIVDYQNAILYSSARNEYIIQRLKRMLARTVWALRKQLEQGDFVPCGYEISFGEECDLGRLGHMNLRGKIDRIDVCEIEDKVYVKVVDYKTGKQVFDLGELCHGLQMQLVVYMNAAVEMEQNRNPKKQVVPAGLFYYKMQDPIVEKGDSILKTLCPDGVLQGKEEVLRHFDRHFEKSSDVIPVSKTKTGKLLSEEDFRIISEYAKNKVRKIGEEILEGKAAVAPYKMEEQEGCRYCPYHTVCGFEEKIPGYEYRELEKLDRDKALEKMRKEVERWQ